MKKHALRIPALLLALALILTESPAYAAVGETAPAPEAEETFPESYSWPAQTDSIDGWPKGPSVYSHAAVVMNADTGALLYAKNKDDTHYPASTTKILTTLLALKGGHLNEPLTLSAAAAAPAEENSSTIYAQEGEVFTLEQALYAVMLSSANEVAYAVGEHTSGNLKRFVELMNSTAKALGCTGTHFNNASGLPDDRHYTTAHDLARIARAAWKNLTFRGICGASDYTIPETNKTDAPREMTNHHRMLRDGSYEGCLGGKTGYTSQAGNTLVTYASREGVTLICVVLKNDEGSVYQDTAALLDYGFTQFSPVSLSAGGTQYLSPHLLPHQARLLPWKGRIPYAFQYEDAVCLLPKDASPDEVEIRQSCPDNLLGRPRFVLDYYYHGQKIGSAYRYGTGAFFHAPSRY